MLGTHTHIPPTRFLVSLGVFDWQPFNLWLFFIQALEIAKTAISLSS